MQTLERALGPHTGSPVALDGGITNRNLQMCFGGALYVVRLCGKETGLLGIDRDSEVRATRAAHGLAIAPEVVLFLPDDGCVVTRWVAGVPARAEQLREPARLAEVARALRAFHCSDPLPTTFDAFRLVESYRTQTLARGGTVPAGFEEATALAGRIEAALHHPEHDPVPCHNDLLTANFLLGPGDALTIVDWEYAGMGDRYFDLGNLSINNGFTDADDRALLEAYWGAPCTPRRFAALRLMRSMSDVREALWGVAQSAISDLDFDFAGYADKHLRRLLATTADPRFESWLRDAATP
jgi:thiamine kinase-like enzyme